MIDYLFHPFYYLSHNIFWGLGLFLSILVSPLILAINQPASFAKLVLTEVYYNTPGKDGEREWVELANLGDETILLTAFKLGDEESIWGGEGMLRFPEGSVIAPGQVIVIAQSAIGFRELYGRDPDYEINDSIPLVPNMDIYALWSSGDFALANDGDEVLLLGEKNQLVDGINYGEKLTYFTPSISDIYSGQSIERIPATCDTDTAADWQPQRFPTPGKIQTNGVCSEVRGQESIDSLLLPIGQIQGATDVSPYINQIVDFRGIVTGNFEDQNAAGIVFYTLFVQDPPGLEDSDPATSDGIAVFMGRNRPGFKIGDVILVKGKVTEYFGLTEIDDEGLEITLESHNEQIPMPIPLDPPPLISEKRNYYESLEGSLISLPFPARVIGPTHIGCGFAVLESDSQEDLPPLLQAEDDLDMGLSVLHQSDVLCEDIPQLKTNDRISGLLGPLTYHFDRYKLVHQDMSLLDIKVADWPIITVAQLPKEDQISLATINMENYFDEKRDSTNSAEPLHDEIQQMIKREKLSYVISNVLACPTLVAVQEVENKKLLQDLVGEVEKQCGIAYQISHYDGPDSRGLDVALFSDPRLVEVVATSVLQTCSDIATGIEDINITCPEGQSPLFGRPPLQVEAQIDGQRYTFIVIHFKSKRDDTGDAESRRIEQASFVNEMVDLVLSEKPETRLVILGDTNDYELSPSMLQLTGGEVLYNVLGSTPLNERYSYIFDGRKQLIDSILVSKMLRAQIGQSTIFHINADYPIGLANDISVQGLPYHSSDHDLPYIVINLDNHQSQLNAPTRETTVSQPIHNYPESYPSPPTPSQTPYPRLPEEISMIEEPKDLNNIILIVTVFTIVTIAAIIHFLKQK